MIGTQENENQTKSQFPKIPSSPSPLEIPLSGIC